MHRNQGEQYFNVYILIYTLYNDVLSIFYFFGQGRVTENFDPKSGGSLKISTRKRGGLRKFRCEKRGGSSKISKRLSTMCQSKKNKSALYSYTLYNSLIRVRLYLLSNKVSDWSNSLAHASDPQLEFIFNFGCGFCSSVTSLEIYAVGLYACVKIYAVGQCACVEFQNKIVPKLKMIFFAAAKSAKICQLQTTIAAKVYLLSLSYFAWW